MFNRLIVYSVQNKLVVGLFVVALVIWGIFSLRQLPIDAVPDITNNQVQVITISPTLATQEVEQFITTPIELALQNIQGLEEIRSISRFGLSVITVVFEEGMDIYFARQLVNEYLKEAEGNIPEGLGTPELAPVTTGLGEIYQYVIRPEEGYEEKYSMSDLRTIQDWIVKRQLSGIRGVVEINTMGGYLKQYEVAVNPKLLKSIGISIAEVYDALQNSNENTGGAYIEKNAHTYYIRTDGIARSLVDIGNIVVTQRHGKPILVSDIAEVKFGKAPRYGALVRDGEEAVGGRVMMLKGENSAAVTERVKERVKQIQNSLPEGVLIDPYLVRDKLVSTAMGTVKKNLLEGGLIVIFILVLLLGNLRAGLIVASVIPLAMLFAVSMMNVLGISANLMSLGAIDFGLIVDGAIIIVEAIVHRLKKMHGGSTIDKFKMDSEVLTASQQIRSSAAFGEIIILMVYIPILALVGIEGKMFKPMAQTVMLAIVGALLLSLTYVPMMSTLFLNKNISDKVTLADKIIAFFQRLYTPVLEVAMRFKEAVVFGTFLLFVLSLWVFGQMGGEFIPTLEEGDLAIQQISPPGTSLSQSIHVAKTIHRKILEEIPEVSDIVTNIGSAEIPTDPMPVEIGDGTLIMKPKSEWTSAKGRREMFEKLEEVLADIPGVGYEFSQPIQLRFNELMTGSKADIAIKIYGDDLDLLYRKAKEAEKVIRKIEGVGTVNVEQTVGMPQIIIDYKYDKLAQYGLQVKDVNRIVRAAFAGESAGVIYEGERRFDLVIRLDEAHRKRIEDVSELYIPLDNGMQVPLVEVARIELIDAPMQISRDNTNRRIVIGVNVGDTDVESLVDAIHKQLDAKVDLPPGYYIKYGGQFENLKAANARLMVAVPIALGLIFILLFMTFGSFWQALLIFIAIPLSAIGGVWSLELRGMPFSISAGIGFIALFGVAVLNGIVLIGYLNQLKREGVADIEERIRRGTRMRLRPVLMTASVASFGFLPMALSTSGGAEVQRPLATVVIGGLITATFLTLVVLPILYSWLAKWQERGSPSGAKGMWVVLPLSVLAFSLQGQRPITLSEALSLAGQHHPAIRASQLGRAQAERMKDWKYSPGKTAVTYSAEGLIRPNGNQVQQLEVTQFFPHPAKNRAQNNVQQARGNFVDLQAREVKQQLEYQVKTVYYSLRQKREMAKVYERIIEVYGHFNQRAKVRLATGAANPIEGLTIGASREKYELLLRQTKLEIEKLNRALGSLLQIDEGMVPVDSLELTPFTPPSKRETIRGVLIQEEKMNMAKAAVSALKSNRKPDFRIGYAAQRFYEGGWLSGVNAGIQVPLFNRPFKIREEVQQLKVEEARAQVEHKAIQLGQELVDLLYSIQQDYEAAQYYKRQVEEVIPEMERISELNYASGNISYLELLNALKLMADGQIQYWEQILDYHIKIAKYQYLIAP